MEWKDAFGNRMNQVRPGYEAILTFIEKSSAVYMHIVRASAQEAVPHKAWSYQTVGRWFARLDRGADTRAKPHHLMIRMNAQDIPYDGIAWRTPEARLPVYVKYKRQNPHCR